MKKLLLITIWASSVVTSYGMNRPALDLYSMSISNIQRAISTRPGFAQQWDKPLRPLLVELSARELKKTGKYPNIEALYVLDINWSDNMKIQEAQLSTFMEQRDNIHALEENLKNSSFESFKKTFFERQGKKWMDTIFPESRQTLLGQAIKQGKRDVVDFLLAQGADPNARIDRQGRTALILAAEQGRLDIIRLLQAYSADSTLITYPEGSKDTQEIQGKTAQWFAEKNRHAEVVKALRSR